MPADENTPPPPDLRRQLADVHAESWGWALRCCLGNHHAAEDALQRSYQKILSGRAAFSGRSSFKTWLFSVIRHTARDENRGTLRRWLRFLPFPETDLLGSSEIDPRHAPSPSSSPAAQFSSSAPPFDRDEATRRAETLRQALARLPPRQAEVLHLVFYHELTLDEAAGVMGVSPGTARTHYERGKTALRHLLTSSPLFP